MIRICMIIIALFVSSQSANAKWLSKEEMVDVIKNGDVLLSKQLNEKINGVTHRQLETWFRMKGIIYYCISFDFDSNKGIIQSVCHDSRRENE